MIQILPPKKDPLNQFLKGTAQVVPDIVEQYQKNQLLDQQQQMLQQQQQMEQQIFGLQPQGQQSMQPSMSGQPTLPPDQQQAAQKEGMQRGSLEWYKKLTPQAKAYIAKKHPEYYRAYESELKRSEKASQVPLREQPISQDQLNIIQKVRSSEGFEDLDDLEQYRAFTDAGVSPVNAEREAKITGEKLKRSDTKFEKSYDRHKDFIEDTTAKYRNFQTEMKPKLQQMQTLNEEELISATTDTFLQALGIPLGALDDPSSELYQKLSQDLLKGLPETYGNRILKVEVENFLKTIPTLANSPEGRRMIASNLLKLGEMKEVYYKQMRELQKNYIDKEKPLPIDFEQRVLDQVEPQIEQINSELQKMIGIKSLPKDTIPFFDPQGNIRFVPKNMVEQAISNGGKRIW